MFVEPSPFCRPPPPPTLPSPRYVGSGQREAQVKHELLVNSVVFSFNNTACYHCTYLVHIKPQTNDNRNPFLLASKPSVAQASALPDMHVSISISTKTDTLHMSTDMDVHMNNNTDSNTNRNMHITINRNMNTRQWFDSKYRSDSGCRQQLHQVSSSNWAAICAPITRPSQRQVMQLLWQIACQPSQPSLQPVLPVLPPSPVVSPVIYHYMLVSS